MQWREALEGGDRYWERAKATSTMASRIARRFMPMFDRVLVQKVQPQTKSMGGLLIPESAKANSMLGTVLAVGPGRQTPEGKVLPLSLKPGDTVVLPEYGGSSLECDGEEIHLYREEDIGAKVDPEI